LCIQQIIFQNTGVKQEHLYPHKYQWQHLQWRYFETENLEDVNLLCRFLFTVNCNEDIVHEPSSFKIILRSTWSSIIQPFYDFFLMSSSWRQLFSLSTRFVNSTRILTSWLPPLILVDTISRDVTRIKIPFKQFKLGFIFFWRIVISRIYFPWKVISKKYFSWTVMRTLSLIHLCESAIHFNSFSNIFFFLLLLDLNLHVFIFYIEITDFHPAFVPCN
jgi:hypothetical protein